MRFWSVSPNATGFGMKQSLNSVSSRMQKTQKQDFSLQSLSIRSPSLLLKKHSESLKNVLQEHRLLAQTVSISARLVITSPQEGQRKVNVTFLTQNIYLHTESRHKEKINSVPWVLSALHSTPMKFAFN